MGHDPGRAAFMKRADRMIKAVWDEICELHTKTKALVAIVAPTPAKRTDSVPGRASVYAVTNLGATTTIGRAIAELPPSAQEVMNAQHRDDIVKILYLEEDGQMRFMAVPIDRS